jgi:hypothetical protein
MIINHIVDDYRISPAYLSSIGKAYQTGSRYEIRDM